MATSTARSGQRATKQDAVAAAARTAALQARQKRIHTLFQDGPSNRLLLSLRSGLPLEIDYALQILVEHSFADAAFIPIDSLPGLPTALLDLVDPTPAKDEDSLRRRLEAALVLRNLAIEGGPHALAAIRPCRDHLFRVLTQTLLTTLPDEQAELKLYLIDVAEIYASTFQLKKPSPLPLARQSPNHQLYSLLARLAQSNDRALLIGAYTLLGALAMNQQNESLFSSEAAGATIGSHSQASDATAFLVERAVSLLSVDDSDLILPFLEFLYQHTNNIGNTSRLIARPDLKRIIWSVTRRIKEGATEEMIEYELQDTMRHNDRGRAVRADLKATYPALAAQDQQGTTIEQSNEPHLGRAEATKIAHLKEPDRAKAWMLAVFESDPKAEITQVDLWKAYQKEFEVFEADIKAGRIPPMLSAAELIQTPPEVFPKALPTVIKDGDRTRYVITGFRVKQRPPPGDAAQKLLREKWRCRWQGCTNETPFSTAGELYQHLEEGHVDQTSTSQRCHFAACQATPNGPRNMRLHLRTHVIPSQPPTPSAPVTTVHAADALDRFNMVFSDKSIRAQMTESGSAAGVGFVASLVLRNCARAIASASQRYAENAQMEVDEQEQRQRMQQHNEEDDETRARFIGFLSGKVLDASDPNASNQPQEQELTKDQLRAAVNALSGAEKDVVALAATNRALASYLTETLECLAVVHQSVDGLL